MNILITRPQPEAEKLAELLRKLGHFARALPLLKIENHPPTTIQTENTQLIFVSKNAVNGYVAHPTDRPCFAVGKSTAAALFAKGFAKVIYPLEREGSEALLELTELQTVKGQNFTLVGGTKSRPFITETLTARGATIQHVAVYQTHKVHFSAADFCTLQHPYDLIVVTSSHALRYLAELSAVHSPLLFKTPVTVLAGNMVRSAINLGFSTPVQLSSFKNSQIIKELCEPLRYPTSAIDFSE